MFKKIIIFLLLIFLSCFLFGQRHKIEIPIQIENKIKNFAKENYPNAPKIQESIYKEQVSDYIYMLNVTDLELKQIAEKQYLDDYYMQKYIYDNQLDAKNYMKFVKNDSIRIEAQKEYPEDYIMQKMSYDSKK